jgi:hypothetical protein
MLDTHKFGTIEKWMCGLLICTTIALSANAHKVAGLTLPLPWDDEAAFIWPAVSFMEHGTLRSDYLNPERPIMWMPPGYVLLLGIIFRATGYSLEFARWLSWIFTIAGYCAAVALLWRHPLRLISIGLCSALWLGGTFVSIGNIARMDSLTFATALCGYLLITRNLPYMGLALLCINILIHPNGVYFLTVAIGYGLIIYRTTWPHIKRSEIVALSIASVLIMLYGAYVLQNKAAFMQDMAMQFGRKGDRNPILHLMTGTNLWYFSALSIVSLYFAARRSPLLLYVGLTAACFSVSRIGMEMWYEVFAEFSFVMMSIGCLWFARYIFMKSRLHVAIVYALVCILTFPVLLFHYRNGFIPGPRNWPAKLTWGWGMRTETEIPYFTELDFCSVQSAVEKMLPRTDHIPARVAFQPSGDGLLFYDAWKDKAHVYAPHFTSIPADIHVVRESRYTPSWQQSRSQDYVNAVPKHAHSLIVRDETEKWHIYLTTSSNQSD